MADGTVDLTKAKAEAEAKKASEAEAEANRLNGGGGSARSIEELADEPLDDGEGQTLMDFGDHQNLSVKGKKPAESEIKIKAISRPIRGQLGDKGDDEYTTFLVRGRLDKIEFVSKRDGDGNVSSKTRRHVLSPISVVPITQEQEDAIAQVIDL